MDNSGEMKSSWKKLLLSFDMSNADLDPLLEKSIYREVFDRLVAEYFNSSSAIVNQELPSMDVQLTSDELNAMRYACGYVPHSLLKRYERMSCEAYSDYIQCLGDMSVEGEGEDLLAYTRKWFELVNRGGLFPLKLMTIHSLFLLKWKRMCEFYCLNTF